MGATGEGPGTGRCTSWKLAAGRSRRRRRRPATNRSAPGRGSRDLAPRSPTSPGLPGRMERGHERRLDWSASSRSLSTHFGGFWWRGWLRSLMFGELVGVVGESCEADGTSEPSGVRMRCRSVALEDEADHIVDGGAHGRALPDGDGRRTLFDRERRDLRRILRSSEGGRGRGSTRSAARRGLCAPGNRPMRTLVRDPAEEVLVVRAKKWSASRRCSSDRDRELAAEKGDRVENGVGELARSSPCASSGRR